MDRARFYLSCSYSRALYCLVKILLVKLKKLNTSHSMLESKLWYIMTVTKNVNSTKMVGFIKACDQKPYKFNFVHF